MSGAPQRRGTMEVLERAESDGAAQYGWICPVINSAQHPLHYLQRPPPFIISFIRYQDACGAPLPMLATFTLYQPQSYHAFLHRHMVCENMYTIVSAN